MIDLLHGVASGTPWLTDRGGMLIVGTTLFAYQGEEESVPIPAGVTVIGNGAFYNCTTLKNMVIPDGVTRIAQYAFSGCKNLADVQFPESLSEIGFKAFCECASLTGINLPESLTSIGGIAFARCSALQSVKIPSGIREIEGSAFSQCADLSYVEIPDGVTKIGEYAFYGCGNLKNVEVPASVIEIGGLALGYLVNMSSDRELVEGFSITGTLGSQAETYAKENGIPFTAFPSVELQDENISLFSDAFVYNGSAFRPAVTVTCGNITLNEGTDYLVSYSDNINAGTANVTVTGVNRYTGSITKSFMISRASQTIKASNLSLTYPESKKIAASGNKGALTYKSADTAIAVVDKSGKVTAKGAGTVKITIRAAETENYKVASKTITVTVAKAAQAITAKASASSVAVGKTVTVSTTGAKGKVSYKSADKTIATVNASTGVVTAKKVGKVRITAASAATANYKAASKTVTISVVPAATSKISAANLSGKGIKLTYAKVAGANGYIIYRNGKEIRTVSGGSTVTWTDTGANTNGGKYTYKIVAKGSTGRSTLSRSLTTYRLARPALSSAANTAAGKMTVKWGKNEKATGYQIQYSKSSSFAGGNKTVNIKNAAKVSKVIGSLTKGKTYYVRIRTYKTAGSKNYWSAWSAKKSVKISK